MSELQPRWLIGIDGGGTKCRATVAQLDGTVLASRDAGPANAFSNYELALENIVVAATAALDAAGVGADQLANCVAGIGLAGLNVPAVMARINHWQHPFSQAFFAHDLHIACLGAHGHDQGAVMVIGTGTCGYQVNGEQQRLFGGHGFPHGDCGSGAWFGLQAVKQTLLALDGFGPKTALCELVLAQAGAVDALGLVASLAGASAADYGRFAGCVLTGASHQDPVCLQIVAEGSGYIEKMAMKLLSNEVQQLALLGGLAPMAATWLSPQLQSHLVSPKAHADVGAVLFAQQQLRKVQ